VRSVLVLDGNQRSALAVTRSIGRRGVRVLVAEDAARSMAGSSRFCAEAFQYPSPRSTPDAFIESLVGDCRRRRVDVLYPMSDITMYHVLKHRECFSGIVIPFGSFDSYEQLSDKWRFFELAASLGLPIPVTHFVRDHSELPAIASQLRFPVVIKPYRSQLFCTGRWLFASVRYADSFAELMATVSTTEYLARQPFLLQEYIEGENQGIFALCDRGVPQAFFSNRRIRDVPPAGGMVVLAESIPLNAKTRAIAERLLSHVGWHGVAMVECKIRHGQPYILETNARFWASTQLAVDCGVDYPWLLYQLANGQPPNRLGSYDEYRRLRTLVGDMQHYYMNAAGQCLNRYESPAERERALAGFWTFWDARTWYEVNRWNDPGPFVYELGLHARALRPRRLWRKFVAKRPVPPLPPTVSDAPPSSLGAQLPEHVETAGR
jgi:predicted ATP-grasp superfamily ATP-dependent carboligase